MKRAIFLFRLAHEDLELEMIPPSITIDYFQKFYEDLRMSGISWLYRCVMSNHKVKNSTYSVKSIQINSE